jgi:hypothetical protein
VAIEPLFLALYFAVMFVEWQQNAATTATMATGNFKFALVTVVSAALVLVTMPVFISKIGFLGVPLALLVAQGLTCHPHNFWRAFQTYGIRFTAYVERLAFPAMTAIAILGASALANRLAFAQLAQFAIPAIIAFVLCGTGIYLNTERFNRKRAE